MQEIKSPQELLSAANIPDYDLRAESQQGEFPYSFSIRLADDKYVFEMAPEEAQEISNSLCAG